MIVAESAADWTDARTKDRESVAGLQTLAANTGGRATVRTNFIVEGVRRMLAENRSYYLLRYYSRAPRDGKFHRISVTTGRPGLDVRSRPGFTAPRASTRSQPQPPPLDRLAGLPIQTHGLDMRAVVVPVPSPTRGGSALLLVAELHGSDLVGAPGVELVTLAVDMSGKVRARDTYVATISPDARASDRWVRIVSRLNVPPGRYQLRLVVRRTDGKASGSVFVEIETPAFSRPLALGGLVIGTSDRRGVARASLLGASLPVVPFATSEFPHGLVIGAGLPLRVSPRHRPLRLTVQARLAAADGTVYDLLSEDLAAVAFTDLHGGVIGIPFPKDPLPAGEYRLTVEVALENESTQRRELTFAVGGMAGGNQGARK